jgi:uncharacterized protein YecE (DUF72 family)
VGRAFYLSRIPQSLTVRTKVAFGAEEIHIRGVRVHTGTSGFSYDEWHGRFYPVGLPAEKRLHHYASRLRSVEINNTFYQMPKVPLLEAWRDAVSEDFRFALKVPRRITHSQRLRESSESLGYFLTVASALGHNLGPVLFQLPPFLRKDAPLLADFLALLPSTLLAAFEFRHPSWFDDEIFALLAGRNAALCGGDAEKGERSPPHIATASFGYLRLRAPSYEEEGLRSWSSRILAERWTDAYVYLKHEVLGPDYAAFLDAVTSGTPEPTWVNLVTPIAAPAVTPKKALARTKPEVVPEPAARAKKQAHPIKGLVRTSSPKAAPEPAAPNKKQARPIKGLARVSASKAAPEVTKAHSSAQARRRSVK